MVSRGEVWWLELPDEGRRPVCVLTRQAALPALKNVVVALVTRTVRGTPTEVPLGAEDGMPIDCVLSLDTIRTVPRVLLTERISELSGTRMHEICRALATATGCA
ncbi:MAG: type II toxin-antitoxin system PemK/MazF family toxin [Thermoleophilaceae bacterium]|nr:type II toxin-antitoxin system PemK/MazF family toxin [Thermoleophilaceae bacterium]